MQIQCRVAVAASPRAPNHPNEPSRCHALGATVPYEIASSSTRQLNLLDVKLFDRHCEIVSRGHFFPIHPIGVCACESVQKYTQIINFIFESIILVGMWASSSFRLQQHSTRWRHLQLRKLKPNESIHAHRRPAQLSDDFGDSIVRLWSGNFRS